MPDTTPPFLTKELIDGWIGMAEARQKEAINALKLEVQDQLHKFDCGQLHLIHKVEKLAGDGEKDEGAVGRLEKLVVDYITENRAASAKASSERQAVAGDVKEMVNRIDALESAETRAKRMEEQVKKWKMIPVFTRNLWKIVAAIATLALALSTLWSRLHPPPVMLTPQQIQEIRKGQ